MSVIERFVRVGKGEIIRDGSPKTLKRPSARIFCIVEKPTPSTQMMMCRASVSPTLARAGAG